MELIPDLWIGDANNSDLLKKKHAKLLINCSSTSIEMLEGETMLISSKIEANSRMSKILEKIVDNLRKNRAVFLIGNQEITVEIAICFLMKYAKVQKETAISMIRSKAPNLVQTKSQNISRIFPTNVS